MPHVTMEGKLVFQQKYTDISGYAKSHNLYEEASNHMFCTSHLAFAPLHELYIAPEIFKAACDRMAHVMHVLAYIEDDVDKIVEEQVKELKLRGIERANSIVRATVFASCECVCLRMDDANSGS